MSGSGDLDGFVLAGGDSRRFGQDKALAGDPPAAVRVGLALRGACARVAVVRRIGQPGALSWPDGAPVEVVIGEEGPGRHTLWGVAVALEACTTSRCVVAATDLLGLAAEDVVALVRAADAADPAGEEGAVAASGGRWALLAVLPRALAQRARELATRGAPVGVLLEGLARVELPADRLVNHNAPDPHASGG